MLNKIIIGLSLYIVGLWQGIQGCLCYFFNIFMCLYGFERAHFLSAIEPFEIYINTISF